MWLKFEGGVLLRFILGLGGIGGFFFDLMVLFVVNVFFGDLL